MAITRLTVSPVMNLKLTGSKLSGEQAQPRYWATYGFKVDSEDGEIMRLGRAVHAALMKWRTSPAYNSKLIHLLIELDEA